MSGTTKSDVIRCYVVGIRLRSDPKEDIRSLRGQTFYSRADAEVHLSRSGPKNNPHLIHWLRSVDIVPNDAVRRYGVERYRQLLVGGFGHPGLILVGTREELVGCGVAGDYMFEQMGEQNSRSGGTQHGDRFLLQRRAKGRFRLELEPLADYEDDPGDLDISGILAGIMAQ